MGLPFLFFLFFFFHLLNLAKGAVEWLARLVSLYPLRLLGEWTREEGAASPFLSSFEALLA